MIAATEDDVRRRVADLLGRIHDPGCPVRLPETSIALEVAFDLRGLAAGQARLKRAEDGMQALLRFNPAAMGIDGGRFMLDEVAPHEVAHVFASLVVFYSTLPAMKTTPFRGHGQGWKMIARWLGATGNRTCDVGLTPSRNMLRFAYKASCGTVIHLTKQRHTKLQLGARMRLRKTGGKLSAEHFLSELK